MYSSEGDSHRWALRQNSKSSYSTEELTRTEGAGAIGNAIVVVPTGAAAVHLESTVGATDPETGAACTA